MGTVSPSAMRHTATTLVPATPVKNPKARAGTCRSSRTRCGYATMRHAVRTTSTA